MREKYEKFLAELQDRGWFTYTHFNGRKIVFDEYPHFDCGNEPGIFATGFYADCTPDPNGWVPIVHLEFEENDHDDDEDIINCCDDWDSPVDASPYGLYNFITNQHLF